MNGRMRVEKGGSVTVPAGSYFLGDPCYAVPDEKWHALLNSCSTFYDPIGTVDGKQVLAFSTMYGDGCYLDQHGNEYDVDAGLIGLTPVSLCGRSVRGGRYVKFTKATRCEANGGALRFGDYVIDTAQEDEDDEAA